MFAIAAMSRNRVVGKGNAIPWRIPDEFKWFRRMTLGRVVIMGRRTFESLPKPLDGRINVVLTRHPRHVTEDEALRDRFGQAVVGPAAHRITGVEQLNLPKLPRTQVHLARGLESLIRARVTDQAWLCGGVTVYQQFLALCSDLYLSVIDREVEGDAFFPAFEHLFALEGVVAEFPEFRVLHYVRNGVGRERPLAAHGGDETPPAGVPGRAGAPETPVVLATGASANEDEPAQGKVVGSQLTLLR
jgi:dihydrofolate reductase